MRSTTDTLPDRGVDLFHMLRSTEKWFGILLRIVQEDKRKSVKLELDTILGQSKYPASLEEGVYLHCDGAYSPSVLKKITDYLARQNLGEPPLQYSGRYEDFIGSGWVRKAKKKYDGH